MKKSFFFFVLFFSSVCFAAQEVPELEIQAIQEGVFLHTSHKLVDNWGLVGSNGLVVVEDNRAFIVDTPWSEADTVALVTWIKAQGYDLLGSISTHSHDDRTAGISWLNEQNIPTYVSEQTNTILVQEGKTPASHPMPGKSFTLADGLLEVFYPGGGHTIDNVVVWHARSKLLFGGCFVRSLDSSSPGYTGEARIDQWASSVASIQAKYPEIEVVVPGHGKLGDAQLLSHTKKLATAAAKVID